MKYLVPLIIAFYFLTLFSCKSNRLFRNKLPVQDSVNYAMDSAFEHLIKPDDKLSISIWNHDDLSVGSIFGIYNSNEVYGKWLLVDKMGEVAIPSAGKIKLAGLNTRQAADTLKTLLSTKIVSPVIVVRVLNLQATILGEVKTPGVFILEKERNSLTEIIGRCGGINYYADVKHVKIIRTGVMGMKSEFIVDISKVETPLNPYPIIKPDDVIYVPPRASQVFDKQLGSIIPIASLISSLALIFTIVAR